LRFKKAAVGNGDIVRFGEAAHDADRPRIGVDDSDRTEDQRAGDASKKISIAIGRSGKWKPSTSKLYDGNPSLSRHDIAYTDDFNQHISFWICEIASELTGHGLPLVKCEAYNRGC
jgi:hypothetical protein